MPKLTPREKADRERRYDVALAQVILAKTDMHWSGIEKDWARRVIENEQKAVAEKK